MKIVIIGMGSMGKRRLRLLKKIFPDMIMTGVDSDGNRLRSIEKEYGIKCYGSLEDVSEELDCAFVCTPPQFHAEIIKSCLERKIHVFSEINLLSNLYEENLQIAKKNSRVLFLSSTLLYREEMQIIAQRVRQNGSPCVYQYHTGQYLPDWHPWDAINNFFVSRKETNGCRELFAIELPWIQNTFGKVERITVLKRKLTQLGLEYFDTYLVQIEHEGGSAGSVIVDVVSRQAVRRLEVFHENLYIRWEGTPDSLYEKNMDTDELRQIQTGEYIHQEGYADSINEYAYEKEIEEFFAVIDGRKKPLYSFEEDKEVLDLIDEIERN